MKSTDIDEKQRHRENQRQRLKEKTCIKSTDTVKSINMNEKQRHISKVYPLHERPRTKEKQRHR